MFPPYAKHLFNVLLFSFVIVTLYLPNDVVNLCGMIKHNEVSNSLDEVVVDEVVVDEVVVDED